MLKHTHFFVGLFWCGFQETQVFLFSFAKGPLRHWTSLPRAQDDAGSWRFELFKWKFFYERGAGLPQNLKININAKSLKEVGNLQGTHSSSDIVQA